MPKEARTFLFVLMLFLIGFSPWWIYGLFLLILNIYIPYYYELIFFGFLIDLLYSDNVLVVSPVLAISIIVFTLTNIVRSKIRT